MLKPLYYDFAHLSFQPARQPPARQVSCRGFRLNTQWPGTAFAIRAAASVRRLAVLAGVASLVVLASPAHGIEVYFNQFVPWPDTPDQANPQNPTGVNGVIASSGPGFAAAAADDFQFSFDVDLKRMVFWSLEEDDPAGGAAIWDRTLRYAIWQDIGGAPGTQLVTPTSWGEFTPTEINQGAVTKTLLREGIQTNLSPAIFFDQYEYSFALESVVGLSANTPYWISVYLGQPTNLTSTLGFFWQQTTATLLEDEGLPHNNPHLTASADRVPPDSPSWFNASTTRYVSNLRFQLIAEPVPLPGTVLLMVPLAGLGVARLVFPGLSTARKRQPRSRG